MRDFQLIVTDDRYHVPSLLIVCTQDEARARTIAERVLAESPHHVSVEVLEYGRALFQLGLADRQSQQRDAPPPRDERH